MKKLLLATWLALAGLFCGAQNITQVEYFLDTDAGVGRNTVINVPVAADGSFPLNVMLTGVPAGRHILSVRTRDENGVWGMTTRKTIEVLANDDALNNVNAEYFFDTDPGFGSAYQLSYALPDSANQISFNANLSGLTPGRHGMYIRSRDSFGRWSITARTVIEVLANDQPNKVISGEYFFDTDPGFGSGQPVSINSQDSVISQDFVAVVSGLVPGPHLLFSRFRDNLGTWSQTSRRKIDVTTAPDINSLVTLEYSINKDAGVGAGRKVDLASPVQNGQFSFVIPIEEFRSGIDTVYFRIRDQGDSWSFTPAGGLIILPLEILNFTATRNDQTVNLNWRTENEVNTSSFSIERSVDGRRFVSVGTVSARPMTLVANYRYDDDVRSIVEPRVYYRLREVDNDGRITYSKVASVDLSGRNTGMTISPNPASSFINVSPGAMAAGSTAFITISDLSGRIMIRQQLTQQTMQRIAVSSLTPGIYTVTIITNGIAHSQKLMIGR